VLGGKLLVYLGALATLPWRGFFFIYGRYRLSRHKQFLAEHFGGMKA